MPGTAPRSSRVKAATCSPTSATRRGSLEPLAREDRAFLGLESARVAGHTLKVVVLDPPEGQRRPDVEALRGRVGERIGRVRCLRRRLYAPTGRRAVFWLDDGAFSVREHVRRALSLGGPVSQDDLRRVCARMMEERLDRSRPLAQRVRAVGLLGALVPLGESDALDGVSGPMRTLFVQSFTSARPPRS